MGRHELLAENRDHRVRLRNRIQVRLERSVKRRALTVEAASRAVSEARASLMLTPPLRLATGTPYPSVTREPQVLLDCSRTAASISAGVFPLPRGSVTETTGGKPRD